jgi:transmembrane sensor
MRSERKRSNRALAEAALWFSRLNETSISTAAVLEFRQWRVQPGNAEAFQQIEKAWSKTGKIADSSEIQTMVTRAEGRAQQTARRRRRVQIGSLAGGLATLAVAVVAGALVVLKGDGTTYQTAVGQQRLIALTDGSRVQLDTDSRIRVRYTEDARQVELLRGRALFDVVHAPRRPMTVRVGETLVRDLGTRFIVGDDPKEVSVTVLSGSVQVTKTTTPAAAQVLKQGQALAVTATVGAPAPVNVATAASWTTGRLVFNNLPLTSAVTEMNRYNRRKLRLDSSASQMIHVSGTFQTGDPDRFAAALTELHGLKASASPGGDVILSRSASHPSTP